MSFSHRILDSELKLEDVLNTFKAIGVNAESVIDGDDSFYVIGNDIYGYTRMYVKDGIVTEFHKFGFDKAPIGMLFNCFIFMAFDTNDFGKGMEFCDDVDELPSREFFAKYYPFESEIYETELIRAKEFEEDHPDLHTYITLLGRTFNSYRYEYAYCNNLSISKVLDVKTVVNFIYERAKDDEELDGMLKLILERQRNSNDALMLGGGIKN